MIIKYTQQDEEKNTETIKKDKSEIKNAKPFPLQPGPIIMAPAKKGGEKKKGRSAINEVVTREYTINIHKRIHGV